MAYQSIWAPGGAYANHPANPTLQDISSHYVPGRYAGAGPNTFGNKSALATALSQIKSYGQDDQVRILQKAALSGLIDRSKASDAVRSLATTNVPQPKLSPFQRFSQFAVPTAKNLAVSTGKAVGQTEAGLLNYLINRHPTSGAVQNIVAKAGPVGQKVSSFVGKPSGKELALSAAQTAVLGLVGPASKGIEAGVAKVAPKLPSAVGRVVGNAGVGAGYNIVATPPPKGGKSGKEFLKEAGVGAGLGGGLSILGQAVSKAVAARKAGVPLPPSALDKHVDAIPKETSLPSSPVAKTTPTPVMTETKPAGQGTSGKVVTPVEGSKVSGVAKGIEARAIEKKLAPTTGFDELATFNPKTHAAENAKVVDLITKDPEKAVRIAQGHESLPNDISGSKLLLGLEEHAHQLKNPDESAALLRDLGKSPLASQGSVHGQELGMINQRNPNSVVAHIQSIIDTRTKAAATKLGSVPQAVASTAKEIKSSVVAPTKQEWSNFVESIKC